MKIYNQYIKIIPELGMRGEGEKRFLPPGVGKEGVKRREMGEEYNDEGFSLLCYKGQTLYLYVRVNDR